MTTKPAPTTYTPLNPTRSEFRVLKLVSTSPEIVCTFSTVSLGDNPIFSALSYEWGDPKATKSITVQGQTLAITTNLAKALEHFLHHWQSQFPHRDPTTCQLWADAICIDQTSIDEKNTQLPLMRDIYERAELVVCWLGGSSPNNVFGRALVALGRIGSEIPSQYWNFKSNTGSWDANWIKSCLDLFQDDDSRRPFGNLDWEGIRNLLEASYWKRAWIIQECVLARSALVACGTNSLRFRYLTSVAEWAATADKGIRPDHIQPYVWNMITDICDWQTVRELCSFKTHGITIHDFFNPLRPDYKKILTDQSWMYSTVGARRRATDPRDHIYGLLALTKLPIVPDYLKPVGDVYREYFIGWLTWWQSRPIDHSSYMTRPLYPLVYSGIASYPEMPSWVPNIPRVSRFQMASIRPLSQYPEYCNESVFSSHYRSSRIENNSLFVSAIRLDRVSHKGVNLMAQSNAQTKVMNFDAVVNFLQTLILYDSQTPGNSYSRFMDAAAAMFCRALYKSPLRDVPDGVKLLRFMIWSSTTPSGANPDGQSVEFAVAEMGLGKAWADAGLGSDFRHINAAEVLMGPLVNTILTDPNSKLVETESGRIGQCPVQTAPGDVICVLRETDLQSVLREKGDHYLHVGSCWFPTITNEEVVRLRKEGGAPIEVVELR